MISIIILLLKHLLEITELNFSLVMSLDIVTDLMHAIEYEVFSYTSYTDRSINDETINIADGSADANTNRQPLIQVTFGMTPLQSKFLLQCKHFFI